MKSNSLVMSFAIAASLLVIPPQLPAQSAPKKVHPAHEQFLDGWNLWDDGNFAEAEKKFREVLTRYPKADYSDRTSYYLITTLIKQGRADEARAAIVNFNRTYPRSPWRTDVEELRLSLDQSPASGSGTYQAGYTYGPYSSAPVGPGRPMVPMPIPFPVVVHLVAPASLEQEHFRIIVLRDANQGIAVAKERLKVNPSDPAVITNFSTIAGSGSPQAFPFFIVLAGKGPNPNTQTNALFWVGRLNNDKDAVGRGLVEMMKEKDGVPVVADVLSRAKPDATRNILSQIVQHPSAEKLVALERIFNSTSVHPLRSQIVQSAGSMPEPAALEFLTGVAKNEKQVSVKLAAIQTLSTRPDVNFKELEEILKALASVPVRAPRGRVNVEAGSRTPDSGR